jgi:eukaryotic-like serine/threonine-protein kinase
MIGEKLGKYTILEAVGNGSMGTVYKAEDPEGHLVAIKLVRSQILFNMEKRERFLQFALIASETRHKGICPIIEIADDNDDFFIITPFITGKTLEKFFGKKPLACEKALDIALEIGDALAALHKTGAAHRGLKPSNIWILSENPPAVLLSDCCIARFTDIEERGSSRISGLGMDFADTLIPWRAFAYMSPEQVRGDPVDCRTDIFSLGVVLYEILSGRHPFEARNSLWRISAIIDAEPLPLASKYSWYPNELEKIIRKALAKTPDARYQKIQEMLADIRSVRSRDSSRANVRINSPFMIRKWLSAFLRSVSCGTLAAHR